MLGTAGWWARVGWALVLEALMVTFYPGWLDVRAFDEFLTVSVLGHVVHGSVLGVERPAPAPAPRPAGREGAAMTRVARWWWLWLPLAVARRLPTVALADGVHLLRWPALAALAPPASLALGVIGARQAGATYTASFVVMATLLSLGLMSVQLGVWGTAGYALGDFWLRAHPSSALDGLSALLVIRVPLLLSYALLALLVVGFPVVVRAAGSAGSSSTVVPQRLHEAAGSAAAALSAGFLVITWAQAVAVLIRPVFTWPGGQPAATDIVWLQQRGWVLGLLAVALSLARGEVERRAVRGLVGTLAARLGVALPVVPVRPLHAHRRCCAPCCRPPRSPCSWPGC